MRVKCKDKLRNNVIKVILFEKDRRSEKKYHKRIKNKIERNAIKYSEELKDKKGKNCIGFSTKTFGNIFFFFCTSFSVDFIIYNFYTIKLVLFYVTKDYKCCKLIE